MLSFSLRFYSCKWHDKALSLTYLGLPCVPTSEWGKMSNGLLWDMHYVEKNWRKSLRSNFWRKIVKGLLCNGHSNHMLETWIVRKVMHSSGFTAGSIWSSMHIYGLYSIGLEELWPILIFTSRSFHIPLLKIQAHLWLYLWSLENCRGIQRVQNLVPA